MKRTGFRQQSLEEIKAKAEAKRLRAKKVPPKVKKPVGAKNKATKARSKLPTVKTMRNKCDKLLTPIIKLQHPHCIFTGEDTQVAHHAIKKSTSSALRYYLPNLIPLTNQAHLRLHCDEILWTGKLIQVKGMDWWEDLMEKKNVYTKCDVHFYIEQYDRLSRILEELQSGDN
jgi:CRISPR/Cas system-associated protein Cas5 (RAMP superfamily)